MKLVVLDIDVAGLELWKSSAETSNLEFQQEKKIDDLRELLSQDTAIVVLDNSVASTNLINLATSCCAQFRQHLFICSGVNLTIKQTVELMQHGVHWVFEKPLQPKSIQQAIPQIVQQAQAVYLQLMEYRELSDLFQRLTYREREVLDLILEGISNKDSAAQLSISVRTVEARRAKVYLKCNTDNMVGLIRKVERLHYLQSRFVPKKLERHDSVLHMHLDSRVLSEE